MAFSISSYFADLPDPRGRQGRQHRLDAMLGIAMCAVICGAEGWSEVALFGRAKRQWFQTFLDLPNGIPSHDTFGRVFAALDPEAFERCFMAWTAAIADGSGGELLAIDGKTIRRSFDRASKKSALHMISAWAHDNRLVFGQLATEAKGNEITAIPKLLALLDLRDAMVTIDAIGCQKAIAGQIIEQGGDYVLQIKGNHPTLHEEVKFLFDEAIEHDFQHMEYASHERTEADHGRIETRRTWTTAEVDWFREGDEWAGLRSFACVESRRQIKGTDEVSVERRYYLSSLDGTDAKLLADVCRGHWGVENRLHWSLDVSFGEDQSRIRQGHAAENFSRLRRMALNLLKRETTAKVGIKAKRLKAGWDHDYLLKILNG